MKLITDLNQIDFPCLEKFVFSHSHGNFFQSPKAFHLFNAVDNHEPFLLVGLEREEIVGSLLAVILKEGSGLKGYFSRRCIVWGGPLVKGQDPEIYSSILSRFNEIIKNKAIYSQLRNFFDLKSIAKIDGFQDWLFVEHLNIIIDLSKPEDVLWKEVYAKGRNKIRRAEKEGTIFQVLQNRNELELTYNILSDVYDRVGLPLPGKEFFEKAFDLLYPDNFIIFLAINEGKIIGTMYVLCFKDIMYDWYAGSYRSYYNKYPNDLIPWEAFLWGKKNGFKIFDFGGAGKPSKPYGVRDYKKKFGGELVSYGRFEQIHKPVLFQIGKLGLKISQKFKK